VAARILESFFVADKRAVWIGRRAARINKARNRSQSAFEAHAEFQSIRILNRSDATDSDHLLDMDRVFASQLRSMAPDADNPTLLQVLVLERVDRAKNMARFYVLSIQPTLFEDLALVRRWGRIGSAGRERIDLHPSRRVAQIELKKWLDRKRRRGYQLRA